MKKLLLTAGVALASYGAFAQGLVGMNTSGNGAYAKFSNTVSSVFFTGNQIYVALYWAPDAATLAAGGGTQVTNSASGTPVGIGGAGIATNNAAGFITGSTLGGNRFIAGQAGVSTFFQLRAWSSSSGALTYADAVAAAAIDPNIFLTHTSGTGAAPIVSATPTPDALTAPPAILWNAGSTAAAQAIAIPLFAVPEPSTIALIGLGLAGLIFIRRRK
jgi:hypothetical protein